METLRLVLLVVHILGFAALFGGLIVQASSAHKEVNGAMRDGVGTAVVAGIALTGVLEADGAELNYAKIGVKLVIGLVLLVLVMANLRKQHIPQGLWVGLILLTVANICVATIWSPVHT